jgi:AcrR family transcriptional regulator
MSTTPRQRGRPRDEELTARRAQEILDIAGQIFAERGFPNTDLQVVADALGIGKGTIYRYFPTKRALFLAAADRGVRRLTETVDAAITSADPLEQMQQGVRAYLGFFEANPSVIELIIQERAAFKDRAKPTYFEHRERNVTRWIALLERLIADGRIRALSVEHAVNVVGDLLYGTVFTNYFAHRRRSLEAQASEIIDLVFRGILSDSERARHPASDPGGSHD